MMKFVRFTIPIVLQFVSSLVANELLLPRKDFACSNETVLALETINFYFERQHCLTVIEYSAESELSRFACPQIEIPFTSHFFSDWRKFNFEEKVDESALSSYPTTRGFYLKADFAYSMEILPVISSFNPRSRLLISLDHGTPEEAEKLLRVAFFEHKMLSVAILLRFDGITSQSLCLFNPFRKGLEGGFFKCFEITSIEPQHDLIRKFIYKRVTNLRKFPLRVEVYEEPLLTKAVRDKDGAVTNYMYADGDMVTHLEQRMNFVPVYVNMNDNSKHGYRLPNGTFTGSLGSIENDLADYVAVSVMISDYKTKKSLFLSPVAVLRLVFVYRKRDVSRMIFGALFFKFDIFTKIMTVGLVLILPVTYVVINKMESRFVKNFKRESEARNTFHVFSLMTNVSSKQTKLNASRVVTSSILFFALVMTSLFQGIMIRDLNHGIDFSRIKTMDELIRKNYELIIERSWAEVFKNQSGSTVSDKMRLISNDPKCLVDSCSTGLKIARLNKKAAFLISGLTQQTLPESTDEENGDIFDFVSEPAFRSYVAPMVPKDSPFIEVFNYWLVQYREMGIQSYQQNLMDHEIKMIPIRRIASGKVPKANDRNNFVRLRDFTSFLYVYLMFVVFSTATFIVEILCSLIKKHSGHQ